ncbi:MAG: MBL fold metallo-hydrolase [Pseudomonadota bacterium]
MTKPFRNVALRRTRRLVAAGLALAAACAAPAHAQFNHGPFVLEVHALNGGVYWLTGGAANTGFIVGDQGVVVIDAQMSADNARAQLATIAKVTPKPVNTLVITHSDPDHIGGAPAYPADTVIFAHENARSQIQAAAADPNGPPVSRATYRALLNDLPGHTVGATETVTLNGVRVVLGHVAPAHSSADLFVYLPDQKVVFAGDIITTNFGQYPIIHYDTGGSSLGWIAAVKAMLALDADTYVPGHGPIETRAMLQVRLRDAEQRREQIKALVNQNKSLAEVKATLPEEPTKLPFLSFVESTYMELTRGYPPAAAPWTNLRSK